MAAPKHSKYLGIAHLIYASIFVLLIGAAIWFFGSFILSIKKPLETSHSQEPPVMLGFVFFLFGCLFSLSLLIPSFVAGYGLLKQRTWARNWGIVAGIISTLNFPIGVAVGAYSLWFLLGEQGKNLYSRQSESAMPVTDRPPSIPYGWQ